MELKPLEFQAVFLHLSGP